MLSYVSNMLHTVQSTVSTQHGFIAIRDGGEGVRVVAVTISSCECGSMTHKSLGPAAHGLISSSVRLSFILIFDEESDDEYTQWQPQNSLFPPSNAFAF